MKQFEYCDAYVAPSDLIFHLNLVGKEGFRAVTISFDRIMQKHYVVFEKEIEAVQPSHQCCK